MRCAGCGAELGHVNERGEPALRTRGLILKAEGVAVSCPRCRADVPLQGEMAKAITARLLVVVPRKSSPEPA